jgi:flagellar biogenesis protein FliO
MLMLVLLSALVGWAAYSRFKKSQKGPQVDAKVQVLGSARVGPKAYAVVTSVGGQAFLL